MQYSELNTKLIESFGELEQLCNQIYNSQHGVTNYIDEMKDAYYTGKNNVYDWDYKLKSLKEIRHKRNKLSHGEVSFNTPWATQEDIQFIIEFKKSIFSGDDPLSINHKRSIKKTLPQNQIQHKYYPSNYRRNQRNPIGCITILILCLIVIYILCVTYFIGVFQ